MTDDCALPKWFLDVACCPNCPNQPRLLSSSSALKCAACKAVFPIEKGVLRINYSENYASNFGTQWNKFRKTQIDGFNQTHLSEDRFFSETGWSVNWLRDKTLLDAGCGAGRFAAIALSASARVVCLDLSSAVDACFLNLTELGFSNQQFVVIQASIYSMPIRNASLDGAYSLGVIQHTPEPSRSVYAICQCVKAGGSVAIWAYLRSWRNLLYYKYYLRLFTHRLSQAANWKLSCFLVSVFLPIAQLLAKVPLAGKYLVRLLPFKYEAPIPGNSQLAKEWSLLDTFDNLAPHYDKPLTESELTTALIESGCIDVKRLRNAAGLAVSGKRAE